MRSGVARGSAQSPLVAKFQAAATASGAQCTRAAYARLTEYLSRYAGEVGYSTDLIRRLSPELAPPTAASPSTWISRARLGVASTGSVLVAETRGEDQIPALLCTRHVLLLPEHAIVASGAEAGATVRRLIESGFRYVTLVTGPSRTSDIEKVLTLGAHGPAELEVILVDGWHPGDD